MAAPGASRLSAAPRKGSTMRPPQSTRPLINRAQTATPTLHGRSALSEISKPRSPKRKASELEDDVPGAEETSINVVVRCRGRNDRELKENSAVVVSSDGIKGKKVELSMGPNAVSNKIYQFDKVFSPAADQGMIFDEVVAPVLDSLLAGLNCTIFAYGQTGTGKTYTMSGDITDTLPIPDAAGIIPRVLHTLFDRLEQNEQNRLDTTVKCAFIELYNEELKDLLAYEQNTKLKIFDDTSKNGRTTTLVQGMEESYIDSAAKGIKLLREGSHKRHVAATRCNDLSSRSHTIFTITVHTKRIADGGEEYIVASKLNLVDLAGSENIQRSGAEAQRATEAGLINKSLLTLGRVINALVDRNNHIPYRESKLTRLLQDSLGGRTKTCIIATLSPAKSNLEETISTLDYAFRAKNIRNKPQMNQLVSKRTYLREFAADIEKLKSELIATRHRNGFYLTAEAYEELTTESESRRILSEEQRDKIETMDVNLRNKVQELFQLTTNLNLSKKENEKVKGRLDSTRDILDKTEIVLAHTKRSLAEQTQLRRAHEETEEKLATIHKDMQLKMSDATENAERLHLKLDRQSQQHTQNQQHWQSTKNTITESGRSVTEQLKVISTRQDALITDLASNIQIIVDQQLQELAMMQAASLQRHKALDVAHAAHGEDSAKTQDEIADALTDAHGLRTGIKEVLGAALHDLSAAAQHISKGIGKELQAFKEDYIQSQQVLSKQVQDNFDDLSALLSKQRTELEQIRKSERYAREALQQATESARRELDLEMSAEKSIASSERTELLSTIQKLVNECSTKQEKRRDELLETANKRIKLSEAQYSRVRQAYDYGCASVAASQALCTGLAAEHKTTLLDQVQALSADVGTRLHTVIDTTNSVHLGTTETIDKQMTNMDSQLISLDEVIELVERKSSALRKQQAAWLEQIRQDSAQRDADLEQHVEVTQSNLKGLLATVNISKTNLENTMTIFGDEGKLRQDLSDMVNAANAFELVDAETTGTTPVRVKYAYTDLLPRTEPHDVILDRARGAAIPVKLQSPSKSPRKRSPVKRSPSKIPTSPSKTIVYYDQAARAVGTAPVSPQRPTTLQEIDVNTMILNVAAEVHTTRPEVKELVTDANPAKPRKPSDESVDTRARKGRTQRSALDGRENVMPSAMSFNGSIGAVPGRKLRNRAVE